MFAVEHLIVGDHLAGVGSHSAHARGEAGLDAALHFVVGGVVADRRHQDLPLVLIGVRFVGGLPEGGAGGGLARIDGGGSVAVTRPGGYGGSLGAVQIAGKLSVGAVDAAALEVELGAVGVGVLDGVVVEVLID